MLLAELEIFHSRPIAPTRRISLGHVYLPVDPAPGFGGLLLGAILSVHIRDVEEDFHVDIQRLLNEVERGSRVVQPRLRHRFQVDRHGLTHSSHRLIGVGDTVEFELNSNGSPLQQVLGCIYVLERLDDETRKVLVPMMRKAFTWRGPIGPSFISYLAGSRTSAVSALADPRAWALDILGFPGGTVKPSKREVMSRFRASMRDAHPDHGGDEKVASKVMVDISEARRILLDTL
ncbi:unannotated protein [freshwater metagenome]|jgi:hypothetical protein|uniref:Unannotated protein n=1 Tax=freshwater metagenome TaxID=449393 RepID=A0A6J6HIB0_9ZZZZ|nr:hypothetical protein [Actinomycetota bacterium]